MMTPLPRALWLCICTVLLTLGAAPGVAAEDAEQPTPVLVQTINTSRWDPPSPDPSGIAYWPAHNTLVVVDGEVEEMAIFRGANVFEAQLNGKLVRTASTLGFTSEPVGIDIAVDPAANHFLISDDSHKLIFEVDLGADERLGTADDDVRSFSTTPYGNADPEGLTLARGTLYIVDGVGRQIVMVDPGTNQQFDGGGDDRIARMDLAPLGVGDPEGIEYNPESDTLYVLDRKYKQIIETTLTGRFVRRFDLRFLNVVSPGDLALAPSSLNPAYKHLYIAARGVDNNADPKENDGKIYEISLSGEVVWSVRLPLVRK